MCAVHPVMCAEFIETAMRCGDDFDPALRFIKRMTRVGILHHPHMKGDDGRDHLKAVAHAVIDLEKERLLDRKSRFQGMFGFVPACLIAHGQNSADLPAILAEDGAGRPHSHDNTPVGTADFPGHIPYGPPLAHRQGKRQLLRRVRFFVKREQVIGLTIGVRRHIKANTAVYVFSGRIDGDDSSLCVGKDDAFTQLVEDRQLKPLARIGHVAPLPSVSPNRAERRWTSMSLKTATPIF